MLFILGGVSFEVQPTNVDKVKRARGHDWAEKHIVGAEKPRESVGVSEQPFTLSGRLLPHVFGAGALEALAAMAQGSTPQMLIRGDGAVIGWHYVIRLIEEHEYLDRQGIGRVIEFTIDLIHAPQGASADAMMSLLGSLF